MCLRSSTGRIMRYVVDAEDLAEYIAERERKKISKKLKEK